MLLISHIPNEVVIRHTCHCETAVEKPSDGSADEHLFTVDGEDFPWFVSERGPAVTRLRDRLYVVDVEILLIDKGTKEWLPFGLNAQACSVPYVPVIDGKTFPWLLTDDGCQLNFSHKMLPALKLAFFTFNVSTNEHVTDRRRCVEDVYCAGGELIANAESVIREDQWLESNAVVVT